MTIHNAKTGELLTTGEMISIFDSLLSREPLDIFEAEGTVMALLVRALLEDLRELENDPSYNPHLAEHKQEEMRDLVKEYIQAYVV